MKRKRIRRRVNPVTAYGLGAQEYHPIPPAEIDEMYYYVDGISGDGRGVD